MIRRIEIKHDIQKYILHVLSYQEVARFRDLRPPKTDSNLYSYHLTQLLKNGFVKKSKDGYTLSTLGLIYVDRMNDGDFTLLQQPKLITMHVIQNSDGGTLLMKRTEQPYINKWTLPSGSIFNTDDSLIGAARRSAYEKLKVLPDELRRAGDCYIRVNYSDIPLTSTLVHVFAFECDDIQLTDQMQWVRPHKLHTLELAPAVEEIIARTFFRDPYFFEEYSLEW